MHSVILKNDAVGDLVHSLTAINNIISTKSNKKITLFSMSHIPRTTLAQNMDALSSQSNIAGYKSIIIGADHISKYMPLLMTAAGTI